MDCLRFQCLRLPCFQLKSSQDCIFLCVLNLCKLIQVKKSTIHFSSVSYFHFLYGENCVFYALFLRFRFRFSISCNGEQWTGEGRKNQMQKQEGSPTPRFGVGVYMYRLFFAIFWKIHRGKKRHISSCNLYFFQYTIRGKKYHILAYKLVKCSSLQKRNY